VHAARGARGVQQPAAARKPAQTVEQILHRDSLALVHRRTAGARSLPSTG
jgi:hypothetical protein